MFFFLTHARSVRVFFLCFSVQLCLNNTARFQGLQADLSPEGEFFSHSFAHVEWYVIFLRVV